MQGHVTSSLPSENGALRLDDGEDEIFLYISDQRETTTTILDSKQHPNADLWQHLVYLHPPQGGVLTRIYFSFSEYCFHFGESCHGSAASEWTEASGDSLGDSS